MIVEQLLWYFGLFRTRALSSAGGDVEITLSLNLYACERLEKKGAI